MSRLPPTCHLPDVPVIAGRGPKLDRLAVLAIGAARHEPDARIEVLLHLGGVDARVPAVVRILERGPERGVAARDAGPAGVQEPPAPLEVLSAAEASMSRAARRGPPCGWRRRPSARGSRRVYIAPTYDCRSIRRLTRATVKSSLAKPSSSPVRTCRSPTSCAPIWPVTLVPKSIFCGVARRSGRCAG